MPAAPKKKTKPLSRKTITLSTRVGGEDGSAPTAEDEVEWLRPLRIERSIGGSRVNVIQFAYDLGHTKEKIVDTLTPKGITRQIEVRELDKDGNSVRLLLWGKLASQPIEITGDTQSVSYVVRIDRHLLGVPLTRVPFWNAVSGAVNDLDRPMIFNPMIDDIIWGNCSSDLDTSRGNAFAFADVLGPDTQAAADTHGQFLTKWLLADAAHRLCWLLNSAETYVKNPTLDELYKAFENLDSGTADHKLKNMTMTKGKYLPDLLDDLLTPFGAAWYVDLSIDDAGLSVRRLKFFRRSIGTPKELYLQRDGKLDPKKSSLTKLSLNYDIANLANKIIGRTSLKQVESTWELYKGWAEDGDGYNLEDLTDDAAIQKAFPHTGRKWVLNESGAWTGLRPEISALTNLAPLFSEAALPAARKFLPCISRFYDSSGDILESRGIVVEYSIDAGVTWLPVSALTNGSFSNLQIECGIWFETPPTELWAAMSSPSNVKLRVTATVEGDRGVQCTATRQDTSPNADEVTLYLDLSDKFHHRRVAGASIYSGNAGADTIDDTDALQEYVEAARSIEDAAELSCSAELDGIDHPEYQLGDLINRVNGVNLSLIRDNPAVGTQGKCLQIMGITLDIQKQRTELLLETFDEEQLT